MNPNTISIILFITMIVLILAFIVLYARYLVPFREYQKLKDDLVDEKKYTDLLAKKLANSLQDEDIEEFANYCFYTKFGGMTGSEILSKYIKYKNSIIVANYEEGIEQE